MTDPHARRMPALFVGHGSPMNAISDNPFSRAWQALGASLPRPRAILCVSAHWETRGVFVTATQTPETIHDFYGFPKALFDVQYRAPGDPALAQRVRELLATPAGTPPAPERLRLDAGRGLDHGAWSVLRVMYPQADIPVLQLSLDSGQPGPWHHALARRLAPLRDEGVLVLGSGNIVHNLALYQFNDPAPYPWALRFAEQVKQLLRAGEHQRLADWPELGADAALAVPTPEHFLPLLYISALQAPGEALRFVSDVVDGSMDMTTVVVGG